MVKLRVLIVGGGFAGMSSAIKLKESGHDVHLIDLDPEWRVYGAGITITGPTLRAYEKLGMIDELREKGAIANKEFIYSFTGQMIKELEVAKIDGKKIGAGGIMRPTLHKMMSDRVRSLNIPVELGVTVEGIGQTNNSVDVTFSTGRSDRFDLVVGADGISSKVRKLAFPDSEGAKPTGQGCWRVSMKKPPGLDHGAMFFGHEYPAGITMCGKDEAYLYMLTPDDGTLWVEGDKGVEMLRERLEPFGGFVAWIRDNMTDDDWVNYRPLEAIIQPKDGWVNGRIVLVGDSAHATTPHLASGAGMAVEGGIALSEELDAEGRSVDESLAAYVERRFERCRFVVESSVEIGNLQLDHAPPPVLAPKFELALKTLSEPF